MDSQRRCRRGQRLCCKGLADEPTLLFGSQTERFAELFRPSLRRRKVRQQRTFDTVAVGEYQKDIQWGDKSHLFARPRRMGNDIHHGLLLGKYSEDTSSCRRRARDRNRNVGRRTHCRPIKTFKCRIGPIRVIMLVLSLSATRIGDAQPVFPTHTGSESEVYEWDELPNSTIDTETQQVRRLAHTSTCKRVSPGISKACKSCPNLARSCNGGSRPCPTLQSSTWKGRIPNRWYGQSYTAGSSRAVDGRPYQYWCGRSTTHTKDKGTPSNPAWWEVELQADSNLIKEIVIYGRRDCCHHRIRGAVVSVLEKDRTLLWSGTITNQNPPPTGSYSVSRYQIVQLKFPEDEPIGKIVRVSHTSEQIHLAEVQVFGTPFQTPSNNGYQNLARLCRQSPAQAYQGCPTKMSNPTNAASGFGVDGNKGSGNWFETQDWWYVDLQADRNLVKYVTIHSRNDRGNGCQGACSKRLNSTVLEIRDVNDRVVQSKKLTGAPLQYIVFNPPVIGKRVRISHITRGSGTFRSLASTESFSISEVQVMGKALESTPETTAVPSASPSVLPSLGPSTMPSLSPSLEPTVQPSYLPSHVPSDVPSDVPSTEPSRHPSSTPSKHPSTSPSFIPSSSPSTEPSPQPSTSFQPSAAPSHRPSLEPSAAPTLSLAPSSTPSISSLPSSPPTALDSDKDGVPDSFDECSSKGGHVDQRGCPIDTDDDGIADCISDLHHTLSGCDFDPQSATFNSTCCNIEWDRCFSDTPPGANSTSTLRAYVQNSTYVNSLGQTIEPGCTSDEDEDGVVDGIDQCVDTTTVEKELAAKADGKMTLYTTGPSAGCAILSESMWNPIFVTAAYNSSNILSEPLVDLIWAVDDALLDIQASRIGAGFVVDDLAKVSILDGQSCARKYEGTTRLGDELFDITTTVKNATNSIFDAQIPEGSKAFRTSIDFHRPVLTQSPLWTFDYTVAEIFFCAKLELVSQNGETKSAQNVPVKIRIDTQPGAILENTKSSEVQNQKESMVATSLDVYYSLMACQCDNDGKCIDNDPTSPNFEGQMLHQGDEVKICIQFDQDSELPPRYVRFADVKTLTCSQDSLIYMPISDYQYTIGSGLTSIRINGDDRKVIVSTIPPSKFFGVEPSIMSCSGEVLYSVYAHDNVFGRHLAETESRLPNSQSQEASFNLKIGLAGNRPKAASNNEFGKNALFASMAIAATILMLGVARPGSYSWLHRRMFPEKVDACVPKLVEGGKIIGSNIYVPKTTEPHFYHSESFLTLPTAASSSARLIDPGDVGRSTRDFRSLTSIQEDFEDSPSVIKDHSAGGRARAA